VLDSSAGSHRVETYSIQVFLLLANESMLQTVTSVHILNKLNMSDITSEFRIVTMFVMVTTKRQVIHNLLECL
jgi:hypothetical protein